MLLQAILLADKAGLRKKGIKKSSVVVKPKTDEEKQQVLNMFCMAVGHESDEQKAERIRNEIKLKQDGKQ